MQQQDQNPPQTSLAEPGANPSSSPLLLLIPILLLYTTIRIPHPLTLIKVLLDPILTKINVIKSATALSPASPPAAQQSLRHLAGGFFLGGGGGGD